MAQLPRPARDSSSLFSSDESSAEAPTNLAAAFDAAVRAHQPRRLVDLARDASSDDALAPPPKPAYDARKVKAERKRPARPPRGARRRLLFRSQPTPPAVLMKPRSYQEDQAASKRIRKTIKAASSDYARHVLESEHALERIRMLRAKLAAIQAF
jgi:hypothetical protein